MITLYLTRKNIQSKEFLKRNTDISIKVFLIFGEWTSMREKILSNISMVIFMNFV